jgi:hypothetical protein
MWPDHLSALMILSCWHFGQVTASERTPFARMLPSVIGSIGSLKRFAAVTAFYTKRNRWSRPRGAGGGTGERSGPALLSTRIIRMRPIWFRVMQRKAPPKQGQSLGTRPRGRPVQILTPQVAIVHTRAPERCTSIGLTFSSGQRAPRDLCVTFADDLRECFVAVYLASPSEDGCGHEAGAASAGVNNAGSVDPEACVPESCVELCCR